MTISKWISHSAARILKRRSFGKNNSIRITARTAGTILISNHKVIYTLAVHLPTICCNINSSRIQKHYNARAVQFCYSFLNAILNKLGFCGVFAKKCREQSNDNREMRLLPLPSRGVRCLGEIIMHIIILKKTVQRKLFTECEKMHYIFTFLIRLLYVVYLC